MELYLTSFLIGIGLAMDCLAVSFAVGTHQKSARIRAALILALFFGGFQCGMTLLGWLLGTGFADMISIYDHWIASFLLFIIGGKMLIEGIRNENEGDVPDIFNLVVILTLSVATSIDALAVGISYAVLNISPLIPSIIIGLVSGVVSISGVYGGGKAGHILGNRVDILGGVILLLIGVKILFEHIN
jgi:manganese efflux pump family protein